MVERSSDLPSDLSLVCRVGTRLCALPMQHVLETFRPLPVEPLAGAPHYVLGLALIRGTAQPVIGLARLLGEADEPPRRFVSLAIDARRMALAVGEVLGLRRVPAASLQDLPPLLQPVPHEVVAALGELDARLLLVLDAARLLPGLEGLEVPQPERSA
jgi:purine-binding chemotaxis protein CheW